MIETKKRDETYARALEEGGVWKLRQLADVLRNKAEPLRQAVFKDGTEHISREDYVRLETYEDVVEKIYNMIKQGEDAAWGGKDDASKAAAD